jgi:glycosyltransferase involved in cell wall biosynthesis
MRVIPGDKAGAACRVSVIVPTFKRPDLLARCLDALMRQDIDPSSYEVIVADDAACPMTREQVERYARRVAACGHAVRYVPVTNGHGPAAARNAGWRAARGEIIAFTDDDCIPTPAWLRAGLAAFARGAVGVSGKIIVPLPCIPTDYERNAAHLATAEFVTANCFYRRDCLAGVGGFDERFTAAWREDSDLIFTLLSRHSGNHHEPAGAQQAFVHAPEAVVIHPVRPARWGISVRQQRKSMFNALLYKKHPVLYREKIQAAPPWRYYGILGALLAICLGLLGRNKGLTALAVCAWIAMTGQFCRERLRHVSHEPRHVAEMVVTSIIIPPLAIFWRLRGAFKFRVWFL